jgi:hypothetical protein
MPAKMRHIAQFLMHAPTYHSLAMCIEHRGRRLRLDAAGALPAHRPRVRARQVCYSPQAIEEFVDLVVPMLQRRDPYRRDYRGVTQRDHRRQDD